MLLPRIRSKAPSSNPVAWASATTKRVFSLTPASRAASLRVRDLGVGDVEAGDVGGAALHAAAARRRRARSRSRGCACRPGRRSSPARRSWRSRRCCARSGCGRSRTRGRGRSRSCVRARRHRTSAAHHTCRPMARVTVCIPTYKRVQWLARDDRERARPDVHRPRRRGPRRRDARRLGRGGRRRRSTIPRLRYVRWDEQRGDRRQLHALAAGRVDRVRDPARRRRHRRARAGGAHGGRAGRRTRAPASRTRASR